MTREEMNKKLKYFITCKKCEVSGKPCDENCPTQYHAGHTGDIIENLEAISKVLEQELCEEQDICEKAYKDGYDKGWYDGFYIGKQGLIDKLLETDKNLSIGKDINGNITVRFEYGYIKDDGVLIGSFGKGETFEEAVIDYCRQINGKTLVFDYPNSKRETFKILILGEEI